VIHSRFLGLVLLSRIIPFYWNEYLEIKFNLIVLIGDRFGFGKVNL
jgi:hypothetical protein